MQFKMRLCIFNLQRGEICFGFTEQFNVITDFSQLKVFNRLNLENLETEF